MRYNAVESRYTGQNLVLILSNKQQQQLIRAVGALEAQGWLAAVLRLRLLSACDLLMGRRCALGRALGSPRSCWLTRFRALRLQFLNDASGGGVSQLKLKDKLRAQAASKEVAEFLFFMFGLIISVVRACQPCASMP